MTRDGAATGTTAKTLWVGRAVSAVPVLLLCGSAAMKLGAPDRVAEGFGRMGWPPDLAMPLALVEIACTLLYVIPHTSILGAILLTGYLGGATATHVRIGESFAVPVATGTLVWLGLALRDARLRALLRLPVGRASGARPPARAADTRRDR